MRLISALAYCTVAALANANGETDLHLSGDVAKLSFGPNKNCVLTYKAGPPEVLETSCPIVPAPPPPSAPSPLSPLPPAIPPPHSPPLTLAEMLNGQPVEFTHFDPIYITSDPPGTLKNTEAAYGTNYNNGRANVPIPPDSRIGVQWKAHSSGGACL